MKTANTNKGHNESNRQGGIEVLMVGDDFNNFNNDFLNSSGNKRVISTAISKLNNENRRNMI